MLKKTLYIEDLILCLAGINPIVPSAELPKLLSSDYSLIHSLGKQVFRNIGFTDRQFELAKRKVDNYSEYFSFLDDLEDIKNRHSIPLRYIDRTRYISIETKDNDVKIAVRFSFQKKLIASIETIKMKISKTSDYDKENKIHYFDYSERNLFEIIEALKDKDFKISDLANSIYNKIKNFKEEDFVPGVYELNLKNLNPKAVKILQEEFGNPSLENLILYKDRSIQYGFGRIDNLSNFDKNSLEYKISNRKHPMILINSDQIRFDQLFLSLEYLKRFPILVLLPADSCYDSLVEINYCLKNLTNPKNSSVVFRLDNQGEGIQFNEYVRNQNLNNKVDKNTKIVYTTDNKIPKPILSSGWSPKTILVYGEDKIINTKKVLDFYTNQDLIIFYSKETSSNYNYYYRMEIEKI